MPKTANKNLEAADAVDDAVATKFPLLELFSPPMVNAMDKRNDRRSETAGPAVTRSRLERDRTEKTTNHSVHPREAQSATEEACGTAPSLMSLFSPP
eukprot:CAMPEP_0172508414 /NCGR_PEP_ID=MMETSP1066-20121228/211777_1 /TAXON_ID=671091 /ORGANISM="Coscinodiscus wailesii, Strain CCMP2513" /LENGTH=96 /DNA_ID=CAMNT_0013286387 /DNA_START=24 /DNA_END=311 /DNA_ORIENTATION=+